MYTSLYKKKKKSAHSFKGKYERARQKCCERAKLFRDNGVSLDTVVVSASNRTAIFTPVHVPLQLMVSKKEEKTSVKNAYAHVVGIGYFNLRFLSAVETRSS